LGIHGVNRQLTSEQLAYQTFMAECGHEQYCDLIKSKIEAADSPSVVMVSQTQSSHLALQPLKALTGEWVCTE
jgi:hypothetical protein